MRALATGPKLLLLDEPAAGMNPSETTELMENIHKIRDTFQIAIMLIEHDMSLVMGICEGIAVLNYGKIIAKGTPEEIRRNPVVIEAYLGKKRGRSRMLKVSDINVYYGNIHAIKDISFEVAKGEIVSLIGANGAGKSTILKTVSGLLRTKTGEHHLPRRRHPHGGPQPHRQAGACPRARGAAHLSADDGAGEPRDGRLYPEAHRAVRRPRKRLRAVSPPAGSAAGRWRAPSRAASSRCWRWAARS